jgi:hypothetical protein
MKQHDKPRKWTVKSQAVSIGRRRLFAAAGAAVLAGCDWLGGENQVDAASATPGSPGAAPPPGAGVAPPPPGGSPAPAPAPAPAPGSSAPVWAPQPSFVAGSQTPFDLAATLPAGIVRGGVFSIDASGAPLPSGMTMTAAGLLYAGTARVGTTTGVIFKYAEPTA